jgi:hypothetical protein
VLKSVTRTISAIVAAAVVAGAVTVWPGASDPVVASAPLNSGKGDRLDIRPLGTSCSERAWPYFETGCVRDRRAPLGQAKAVRVVSTDRTAK